ncbi:hypothetical protein PoB_007534900 [Plakobranchus ocellatus]|uniref:Uncharacterized protein n=1 Tax=Plakobranchus ocellatus TaxID=259542 RepID=A0AAV4DXN7_9GAST|nr:hypothetical protein PoB_007534900 [Plakobranchus ocellatus]
MNLAASNSAPSYRVGGACWCSGRRSAFCVQGLSLDTAEALFDEDEVSRKGLTLCVIKWGFEELLNNERRAKTTSICRIQLSLKATKESVMNYEQPFLHLHSLLLESDLKQKGKVLNVGGAVVSKFALKSAWTLLSRVRAPLPAPWPKKPEITLLSTGYVPKTKPRSPFHESSWIRSRRAGGVGGIVDSECALTLAGALLTRARARHRRLGLMEGLKA